MTMSSLRPVLASMIVSGFAILMANACDSPARSQRSAEEDRAGTPIEPPFAVRGDLRNLMLVYFDDEGAHTAASLDEIPNERRDKVRVDSLSLPPDQREPNTVYIADLRQPREDGSYAVRRMDRSAFDELVDATSAPPEPIVAATADADVVLYGAAWCGACRQAKAHFTRRGIPFTEKDIERDSGARSEMQRKAQQAGLRPSGIPVIDFRGTILTGFDPGTIDRLNAQPGRTI